MNRRCTITAERGITTQALADRFLREVLRWLPVNTPVHWTWDVTAGRFEVEIGDTP